MPQTHEYFELVQQIEWIKEYMKSRPQKRYTSEEELVTRIDAKKEQAQDMLDRALHLEDFVKEATPKLWELELKIQNRPNDELRAEFHELSLQVREAKSEIIRLNKRRAGILNTTLPNLKATLAAFRTQVLPGVEHDGGVVLERASK